VHFWVIQLSSQHNGLQTWPPERLVALTARIVSAQELAVVRRLLQHRWSSCAAEPAVSQRQPIFAARSWLLGMSAAIAGCSKLLDPHGFL